MADAGAGNLRRPIGSVYQGADIGGICTIATDDADELFHVVPADGERRPAISPELRGAECIALLPRMIKLVLDQRAELCI